MDIIALVGSIVAIISAVCAVVAFFIARNKDKYSQGENDGSIKGDIRYMRNSFDDLRLDVKEISRNQDMQNERITRIEESCKSAHKRLDSLEGKQ